MRPVSELAFNDRPNSRKEKNKLASRACRLKKKAQHEANKIKLNGLEIEHSEYRTIHQYKWNFLSLREGHAEINWNYFSEKLMNGIQQAKQILVAKINESSTDKQEELTHHLEKISRFVTSKFFFWWKIVWRVDVCIKKVQRWYFCI